MGDGARRALQQTIAPKAADLRADVAEQALF